jgi:hypothetical protein
MRPRRSGVVAGAIVVALVAVGCGPGTPATRPVRESTTTAPPGTRAVSYLGLTIDVPSSWVVQKRNPCGMAGPGVMVGAAPSALEDSVICAMSFMTGTVVTFGGPDPPPGAGGPQHRETIHGARALVSESRAGTQGTSVLWQEAVRFPHRRAWLDMEAPGATAVAALAAAQAVAATVHVTGGASGPDAS